MPPNPHQSETVPVDGGGVPVAVRRAGARTGPALVIVPSVFGIDDDLVAQMDALAPDASLVVAMDLFWRGDHGPVPYDDMKTVMGRIQALDRAKAWTDFAAVVEWARAQPGCDGRVVAVGVCFGGPFAFLGAADGLLQGVVTWHGTRLESFLDRAASMRCPMALHFGDRDRVVPMAAVEQIRAAFAGRPDVEIAVHPGADHGFTHATGPTWDPAANAAALAGARRILAAAR
jgi:carboxymethylenebutenolidase